MSADDNKALARRLYEEVIGQRKLDLLDEIVAADFTEHEELPGMPNKGPAAPRAAFEMFLGGFPDMAFTAEDMIAEGDKVAARVRVTGTHTGEFMGIPPTGRSIDIETIDIIEVGDGKAVAHWGVMDQAAMMQQLGLAPDA
jgi:predicted ester cyclase